MLGVIEARLMKHRPTTSTPSRGGHLRTAANTAVFRAIGAEGRRNHGL